MSIKYPKTWFHCSLKHVPKCAGCYAIYQSGRLVYIGSTANLRSRLATHRTSGRLSFLFINGKSYFKIKLARRYGDWVMREMRLIARLSPPKNCKDRGAAMLPKTGFRERPLRRLSSTKRAIWNEKDAVLDSLIMAQKRDIDGYFLDPQVRYSDL